MKTIKELEAEIQAIKDKEKEAEKQEKVEEKDKGTEITLEEAKRIVAENQAIEKAKNEVSEFEKYKLESEKTMGELSAQSKAKDKQISELTALFQQGKTNEVNKDSNESKQEEIDEDKQFLADMKSLMIT